MNFPRYIKIKKAYSDKEIRIQFKYSFNTLPKKMKVADKEYFILKCNDRTEYDLSISILAEFMCRYLMLNCAYDLFDEAEELGLTDDRIYESLNLCCEHVLKYGIYLTKINVHCFLANNDVLNFESFMRFNMNELGKTYLKEFSDVDLFNDILMTASSTLIDIAMLSQYIDVALSYVEKAKVPPPKDYKIFVKNGQLQCMINKDTLLTNEYLKETYKLEVEDFIDLQFVSFFIPVLRPNRVVFYSSVNESQEKIIKSILSGFAGIYSGYKCFKSEEQYPL